jgi:hypothetical protein
MGCPLSFCDLHCISSLCSDHALLLLWTDSSFFSKKRFYFQSVWTRFPEFKEVVKQAWHCPLCNASPFGRLNWLLCNMTCSLKSCSVRCIGSVRMQLGMAKEVILRLESVRDWRHLADHEEELCQLLKLKSLGLASLQCSIFR